MKNLVEMASSKIGNTKIDDLFKSTDPTIVGNGELIRDIEIKNLVPFENHPFKVLDDEKMEEMKDSIEKFGVLMPIIVRPIKNNNTNENTENDNEMFEIIAGHRRTRASELLELKTIPCIIRELADEESTILMVDSNIQREELLFSEKAFAYKLKLEAIKKQGARRDLTSSQVGTQKRSDEIVSSNVGESRNQIQRYIRLTNLTKDLLNITDSKKLPFNTAVELSYLKQDEQVLLFDKIELFEVVPSLVQAQEIKNHSAKGSLTSDVLTSILFKKSENTVRIRFKKEVLNEYFPKDCSEREMYEILIQLLDEWKDRD